MAGGGNAIRGSRVGAGPMGEAERGEAAPRQSVTYFCSHEHRTLIAFAVEAAVPDTWDCPRCGLPASMDSRQPAPGPEDRALQDAPGLREGAPLRRRGQGHPRRGHPDPPPAPQVRRGHLLVPPTGQFWSRCSSLTGHSLVTLEYADRAARCRRRQAAPCGFVEQRPSDLRASCRDGRNWLDDRHCSSTPRCPLPLDAPFTASRRAHAGRVPADPSDACSTAGSSGGCCTVCTPPPRRRDDMDLRAARSPWSFRPARSSRIERPPGCTASTSCRAAPARRPRRSTSSTRATPGCDVPESAAGRRGLLAQRHHRGPRRSGSPRRSARRSTSVACSGGTTPSRPSTASCGSAYPTTC